MNNLNTYSLDDRIKRLNAGLPSYDDIAIKIVEKSANITMKDLFLAVPDGLQRLKSLLPHSPDDIGNMTYMELALAINQKMLSKDTETVQAILFLLLETFSKEYERRKPNEK